MFVCCLRVCVQMYQFVICPFRNVTQREYRATEWNTREEAQKQGALASASVTVSARGSVSESATTSDRRPVRVPAKQTRAGDFSSPTTLGFFLGWEPAFGDDGVAALHSSPVMLADAFAGAKLPSMTSEKADAGPVMRYALGNRCGLSEPPLYRSAAVRLLCGNDTAVVSAVENGECRYDIAVTTPFVCTRMTRARAGKRLAALQAELKSIGEGEVVH